MKGILSWRRLLLLLAALSFTGCSDMGEGLSVLWGNYAFQRGEFQRANLDYLKVQESGKYQEYVKYNLGNVYNALGESNSALAIWNTIPEKTSEELAFRLFFNKGHLYFQKGLYQEAFDNFKSALLLEPSNLDAKRNLELTLAKIQAKGNGAAAPAARPTAPAQAQQEAKAMLDYIQRVEGNQWKSNHENSAEPPSSSDW